MSGSELSLALSYFENCLIHPPTYPGTLGPAEYLLELGYELTGNFKNLDEVSEQVGETLGSELVKVVIALCIKTITQESISSKEVKKLEKALIKVYNRKDLLVRSWRYQVNMEKVAAGAARNLNYLIEASKPNVTLQTELNVDSSLSDYRQSCLEEFSPVRLRELLAEEIRGLTGFIPKF
jgi:hypothetical protein